MKIASPDGIDGIKEHRILQYADCIFYNAHLYFMMYIPEEAFMSKDKSIQNKTEETEDNDEKE